MKKRIRITTSDIKHGKRGRCYCCPVKRGLDRAFPETKHTGNMAGIEFLYVGNTALPAPKKVRDWIRDFDKGFTVKPFSFTLNLNPC